MKDNLHKTIDNPELQRQADTSTVTSDDNASNDFLTGMVANTMLDETTDLATRKVSHEDNPNTLESIWKETDADDVPQSDLQNSSWSNTDSDWSDSSSDSSWSDSGWSDGSGFGDGGGCDGGCDGF